MTLLEELRIFVRNILHWIFWFIGLSVFFFMFGSQEVVIYGKNYLVPAPAENSFSIQVFNRIRHDLLPPDVQIIVTNPMSAFVSQILLSLLLGFLVTFPFFIYRIILYIRPALLPHERKMVLWSLIPFVLLFFSGAAFSYFFLIPATFTVLYPYATLIGATPFFSIDEFTYYITGLMVAVGLMFLLPLFMILLSGIGLISPEFWRKNWRYSALFFLILSAIITPDGTGVTMVMLFLPLATLYLAGYFFANRLSKSQ